MRTSAPRDLVRPILALSLAAFAACIVPPDGVPAGGVSDPGGSTTHDAGTADAGCAGDLASPLSVAYDECLTTGAYRSPSIIANGCAATLYLDNIPSCTGQLSGPHNTFNGTCGNYTPCHADAIPGTISCRVSDAGSTCVVVLCGLNGSDGGADAGDAGHGVCQP